MFKNIIDKETRNFFLIIIGFTLVIFVVFPIFSGNPFSGFGGRIDELFENILNSGQPKEQIYEVNTDLNYEAVIKTSQGEFTINLYEANAPKNVSFFIDNALKNRYNDVSIALQGSNLYIVPKFRFNSPPPQEINANSLGLDILKVEDASYLSEIFLASDKSTLPFEQENLYKYGEFTIKDFLDEQLGYEYIDSVSTLRVSKYTILVDNFNGVKNTSPTLIIVLDDSTRIYDGRYTPIGTIKFGTDIIDKIIGSINNSPKIESIEILIEE